MIDPQAAGVRDDGTEHGIVSVELSRGPLVALPFKAGAYSLGLSGAANGSFVSQAFPENDDGTRTGIFISVPASASLANSAVLAFWTTGPVLGLRVSKAGSYASPNPIGCQINGRAYEVDVSPPLPPNWNLSGGIVPPLHSQIIARDLGDGPQYIELSFPAFLSGTTRLYGVLGYLVDSAVGYRPLPRGLDFSLPKVTLTTNYVGMGGTTSLLYGWRKVVLFNSDASPVPVSLAFSDAEAALAPAGPTWCVDVPAGRSYEIDAGGPCYQMPRLKATVGGVVTAKLIGVC